MFRASFCWWGHLRGRGHRPTRTRWSGPAPRSSCCTPARWSTTTTWTPRTAAAAGPRRTAPSSASTAAAGWRGDPEQYGAAAAILLGDLLLSWSDELLRRCGLPPAVVAPALDVFDLCRTEVIAGQFLDVSAQARGQADVDTAMTVLRYKSAKYSIERPLHLGAALAGGSASSAGRAVGVRPAARRGVPAPRRPARRLRRPRDHRQAGRRRPGRGQAHRAGRAGPGRRPGRGRRRCSTARSARPWRPTRSSGCARSSTPPARTPRWRR